MNERLENLEAALWDAAKNNCPREGLVALIEEIRKVRTEDAAAAVPQEPTGGRHVKHSASLDLLAAALASAQGQMAGALKASENPFYKSKYADLASVWEACREPLANNALAVVQSVHVAQVDHSNGVLPVAVTVTTMLMHASGQWISGELTMWPKDNTPQAIGSCTSYARRYSLAAMVGVYQKDDDAEDAQGHDAETSRQWAMNDVINALQAGDAPNLRALWNDATVTGTAQDLWRMLTTKQKKTARELLNVTAPKSDQPPPAQEAEPPHGEGV